MYYHQIPPIPTLYKLFDYQPSELICLAGRAGTGKTMALLLDAIDLANEGKTSLFVSLETPVNHIERVRDAVAYRFGFNIQNISEKIVVVEGEDVLHGALVFGEIFPFELFGTPDIVLIDSMSMAMEIAAPPDMGGFRMMAQEQALFDFTCKFREFLYRYRKIGIVSQQLYHSHSHQHDEDSVSTWLASALDKLAVIDGNGLVTIRKNRYQEQYTGMKKIIPFREIYKEIEPLLKDNWQERPLQPIPDNFRMSQGI